MLSQFNITDTVDSIASPAGLIGNILGVFDIDFNCINAAFPPKKAQKETNAFVQTLFRTSGYNTAVSGNNTPSLQTAANKVLKILDYMEYWRKKTGDGRGGCTREGEYLASKISGEYSSKILESLKASYTVSITNHTDSYKSGFNNAPSRPTSYRQVKLLKRKSVAPVNLPPSNADGSKAPTKFAPPSSPDSNGDKPEKKKDNTLIIGLAALAAFNWKKIQKLF